MLSKKEADKIVEELFTSTTTFEDYKESFYNDRDYKENEQMRERDLKGDL